MSYRNQNTNRSHARVPGYYVGNNLYPNSYTQNEAPTRTSRRIHDGLSITRSYGLDTVSDDVNSSPYSSPYYVNGRYNGMEQTTQRGSASSVQGMYKLVSKYDDSDDFTTSDIQTTIEMWQGKQIKFTVPYAGKVVGNTLTVKNTGGCTGLLSIYLSASDGGPILYETTLDLCKVSSDKFEHFTLYGITPVAERANPKGVLYVRMEIWDEISMEKSANPFNTGRKIEIAATGVDDHMECVYMLGDKNVPVEESYEYVQKPSRPCMGLVYNEYTSVPTNRVEETDFGATVSLNGYKYDLFTIKSTTTAEMLVYDRANNKLLDNTIRVDARTEAVNLVQGKDYVYYVDGYSPLQKFKIGEWISQEVTHEDNPPVLGPSIICKHNGRIYIAGFTYDKNLVQCTEITESGSDFDSYRWRFYSPDESPLSTSDNVITAIVEYQTDQLAIFCKNSVSLWASNRDLDNGQPSQVSIYTDGNGVQSSGDVTNYHGVLYSFDADEGLRRFSGAVWNKIPAEVDSSVERVDMTKPRKLWGYAGKLYLNYTDKEDGKAKCIIWDMDMNYQQYPFFQDIDIPFCDVRTSDDFELIGIHPDYPCIMRLYAEDTWSRLDSPIVFRRDTKYLSLPGNAVDMILKRVHVKVLANCNRWWNFAISKDAHNIEATRKINAWYRVPSWDTINIPEPVENPFAENDQYEDKSVDILTMSNLKIKAISIQVKTQTKTFRNQASLISVLLEAQAKQYL